jgi:predicted DsbA family dithiol-disulfide isomerase
MAVRRLVIYGDFACPHSYLASLRSQRLVESGRAEVEWRAVTADLWSPRSGRATAGTLASKIGTQIEEIRRLAGADESLVVKVPTFLPDTTPAVLALASAEPPDAPRLRQALFLTLWRDSRDIANPLELHRLGARLTTTAQERVDHWDRTWRSIDQPTVPMMMLQTGWVLRGVDVLHRLRSIATGAVDARRREFLERRMTESRSMHRLTRCAAEHRRLRLTDTDADAG